MSVAATKWARAVNAGSPTNKLVLYVVCDHADLDGTSWPSIETITEESQLSRRAVIYAIADLVKRRLVVKETQGRGNLYRLVMRASAAPVDSAPDAPVESASAAPEESTEQVQEMHFQVQQVHLDGATDAPEGILKGSRRDIGPRKRGKIATKMTAGWMPDPQVRQQMLSECPQVDHRYEHARFVDYWIGNGRSMKDWNATWRNWVRKAAKDAEDTRSRTDRQHLQPLPAYREPPRLSDEELDAIEWG